MTMQPSSHQGLTGHLRMSEMVDREVTNILGEDLGKIEDVVIDCESGRAAYAILSFGGFLGLGDKLFAVPWGVLRHSDETDKIVIDVVKDQLESAPGFDKHEWPDMADRQWGEAVHAHWGQRTYW